MEIEPQSSGRAPRIAGFVAAGLLLTLALVSVLSGHLDSRSASHQLTLPTRLTAAPCEGRPPAINGMTPFDVMPDLVDWKLQLPCEKIAEVGNNYQCTGDYTELLRRKDSPGIKSLPPGNELKTFSLLPKAYAGDFCSGGFYVAEDPEGEAAIAINTPTSGTTTSGSDNPRVELREMAGPSTNGGFKLMHSNGGMNSLEFQQRIMHVPPNYGSTCFAQVFNGGYYKPGSSPNSAKGGGPFIELITKKCEFSWQRYPDGTKCPKGSLNIMVWKDGKYGGKGGVTLAPYELGTKFKFKIDVPGDGTIHFNYMPETGNKVSWTLDCNNLPSGVKPCLSYGNAGEKSNGTATRSYSFTHPPPPPLWQRYTLRPAPTCRRSPTSPLLFIRACIDRRI